MTVSLMTLKIPVQYAVWYTVYVTTDMMDRKWFFR